MSHMIGSVLFFSFFKSLINIPDTLCAHVFSLSVSSTLSRFSSVRQYIVHSEQSPLVRSSHGNERSSSRLKIFLFSRNLSHPHITLCTTLSVLMKKKTRHLSSDLKNVIFLSFFPSACSCSSLFVPYQEEHWLSLVNRHDLPKTGAIKR